MPIYSNFFVIVNEIGRVLFLEDSRYFCFMQKLTDEYMKKIETLYKQKEKVLPL